MELKELNCTYGSNKTPDTVYIFKTPSGLQWYAVDGSTNVNATYGEMREGVNVEELSDVDAFTAGSKINSVEDLERAVLS